MQVSGFKLSPNVILKADDNDITLATIRHARNAFNIQHQNQNQKHATQIVDFVQNILVGKFQ